MVVADDQHHDRHAQRHAKTEKVAEQVTVGDRSTHHDANAKHGDETGRDGRPGFSHTKPEPTQASGDEWRDGEQNGGMGYRGVAQRIDLEDR